MDYTKFYILKYKRTLYGKMIRKLYESGDVKEKRCNMRERTAKNAEFSNTLTTIAKDNMIVVGKINRMR